MRIEAMFPRIAPGSEPDGFAEPQPADQIGVGIALNPLAADRRNLIFLTGMPSDIGSILGRRTMVAPPPRLSPGVCGKGRPQGAEIPGKPCWNPQEGVAK